MTEDVVVCLVCSSIEATRTLHSGSDIGVMGPNDQDWFMVLLSVVWVINTIVTSHQMIYLCLVVKAIESMS